MTKLSHSYSHGHFQNNVSHTCLIPCIFLSSNRYFKEEFAESTVPGKFLRLDLESTFQSFISKVFSVFAVQFPHLGHKPTRSPQLFSTDCPTMVSLCFSMDRICLLPTLLAQEAARIWKPCQQI